MLVEMCVHMYMYVCVYLHVYTQKNCLYMYNVQKYAFKPIGMCIYTYVYVYMRTHIIHACIMYTCI